MDIDIKPFLLAVIDVSENTPSPVLGTVWDDTDIWNDSETWEE